VRVFYRALHICFFAFASSGCADLLPWPGFESKPALFSHTEQIPATEVAEQVRCELAQFVAYETGPANRTGKQLLDPNGGAQVQLKLTTDLQGYVQWLGINLKGLGLGSLAELVSKTNNVPSLQVKAQGKTTTVSRIDFVIPQTAGPTIANPNDKTGKKTLSLGYLALQHQKGVGCGPTDLETGLKYGCFNLWLSDPLQRYSERILNWHSWWRSADRPKKGFYDIVCQPKLTISTQFQLLFDVSAGTNIFNASPIILPISGLTIDGSPDYTHYLQIAFTLKQHDKKTPEGEACAALQPKNAPSAVGGL
jgi:hypothetical protein